METRRNVLLLFSKLPEPGRVKTRLTVERGGVMTREDASALFAAMLCDVASVCLAAFARLASRGGRDAYELVVSTAPASNAPAMRALLEDAFGPLADASAPAPDGTDADAGAPTAPGRRFPVRVISDAGATFDEHYNDAFGQCWHAGADCILSMGADMPALTVDDVVRGFEALHRLDDEGAPGIVLAPDQEMGVSIVGWNGATGFDHDGVFYNATGLTVLPAYVEKARAAGIAALYLPPVPDVDTVADLMHNITLANALEYCARFDGGQAPTRTLAVLHELGLDEVRVPPNDLMDPRDVIDG